MQGIKKQTKKQNYQVLTIRSKQNISFNNFMDKSVT